jgi:putative membrane protein
MSETTLTPQPTTGMNNRPATIGVLGILAVSALAVLFLLWLLYVHHPPASFRARFRFLPELNAILNALSAIALSTGFYFIRKREIAKHRAAMLTAFAFSSVFLVSYILNHALHGDTLYPGHSTVRTVYLSILASHIVLSTLGLPLILITFFLSLSGRIAQHRKLARWTFPLWLYVSITGVVVYFMLHAAVGAAY